MSRGDVDHVSIHGRGNVRLDPVQIVGGEAGAGGDVESFFTKPRDSQVTFNAAAAVAKPSLGCLLQHAAFQQQAQGDTGSLRIQVDEGFQYGIGIDDKRPGDMEVISNGVTILVDPDSAKRADGMTLDFREGSDGGVVIDNPNEPAQVNQLSVTELKALMDDGTALELLDVRTDDERETAIIEGSRQFTRESMTYLEGLDKGAMLVLHCHHGGRSQQAAEQLRGKGFSNLHNVVGGIDAWSLEIDSSVPRY